MGQILRIKLVDQLPKAINPFKRPNSLLEGAHCTKLNQLDGVEVIFYVHCINDEHVLVEGQVGHILRIKLVD